MRYLLILLLLFHLMLFSTIIVNKGLQKWSQMMIVELNSEHMTISCRLSDYFDFKLSENGSVLSVENVYCMTYRKALA